VSAVAEASAENHFAGKASSKSEVGNTKSSVFAQAILKITFCLGIA